MRKTFLLAFILALVPWGAAQRLEPVTEDLVKPVFAASAPGAPERLYVAGLDGFIHIVNLQGGAVLSEPFLSLSGRVTALKGEQGFYAFAFHPDFADNGRVFVSYTEAGSGDVVVQEYYAPSPEHAEPEPRRELFRVGVSEPFHHGGALAFGPDRLLYASFGDGIFSVSLLRETKVAQDLSSLRGKLVRVDVDAATDAAPYAVPSDNPFVGTPDARPEIFAYGFRNPWKLAFDPDTGLLLVADVGNDDWEEVNAVVAGGNYGWPAMEGPDCFRYYDDYALVDPDCPDVPERYAPPRIAYRHLRYDPAGGNSVTGGFVYRGAHAAWKGRYLYGDFVSGRVWSLELSDPAAAPELLLDTNLPISAFVQDAAGEPYLIAISGGLYRLEPEPD